MKQLDFSVMEAQIGGISDSMVSFLDGVVCGIGIGTIAWGWGAFLVAYGCGRAFDLI